MSGKVEDLVLPALALEALLAELVLGPVLLTLTSLFRHLESLHHCPGVSPLLKQHPNNAAERRRFGLEHALWFPRSAARFLRVRH